jgi:hypothetical protein
MLAEQSRLTDITSAARQILLLVNACPPHVRPWLRGIEAEAEHIATEVHAASERASRRFVTWLMAGLDDDEEDEHG